MSNVVTKTKTKTKLPKPAQLKLVFVLFSQQSSVLILRLYY